MPVQPSDALKDVHGKGRILTVVSGRPNEAVEQVGNDLGWSASSPLGGDGRGGDGFVLGGVVAGHWNGPRLSPRRCGNSEGFYDTNRQAQQTRAFKAS
ncbi:hypothetical protein D3C75_1062490 [compost metagenome]